MSLESPFFIFFGFSLLLLALAWCSNRIGLLIQQNVLLLARSADLAMVVLFLVYLPGIVVHEGAHWLMAKLLGLKTGNFRVWPKKQGKYIGLGSVSIASGGTVADSLVGMAPLIAGSLLVMWISSEVFATEHLSELWTESGWVQGVSMLFADLYAREDGLLWAYLIFVIANAMMPSSSDREPLKPLLLYVLVFAVLYLLVDQSGQLLSRLSHWLVDPLRMLSNAFLFTFLIDLVMVGILSALQIVLSFIRR